MSLDCIFSFLLERFFRYRVSLMEFYEGLGICGNIVVYDQCCVPSSCLNLTFGSIRLQIFNHVSYFMYYFYVASLYCDHEIFTFLY